MIGNQLSIHEKITLRIVPVVGLIYGAEDGEFWWWWWCGARFDKTLGQKPRLC